ncbi:MAG: LPS assembly lipoprotein LptE [Candidatus Neomarinimicrobiota bacterium]
MKTAGINGHAALSTVFTVGLLTGCGFYSFTGSIPPHIKSIGIPLFVNETPEFGIAESMTDEVTEVFIEENVMRVVDEENSDSILRGTIKKITDAPYTYTVEEEVSEYRFSVIIEVEWYDAVTDKTVLKKEYSGWGPYSLGQDISSDGIDNDGDGRIDSEDPDEIGDPRLLAAKVAVGKIVTDVINDIVSTW